MLGGPGAYSRRTWRDAGMQGAPRATSAEREAVADPRPSPPGAYRVSGGNNNDVSANTNIAEQRRDGSSQLTDEQVGEVLGNLGITW